jgi:hypothetical protein
LIHDWNHSFCIEEKIGTSYTLATIGAIATARAWVDKNYPHDPLLVFVEKGDADQHDFRQKFLTRQYQDDGYIKVDIIEKKWQRTSDGEIQYRWQFDTADWAAWNQRDSVVKYRSGTPAFASSGFRKVIPKHDVKETHWVYIEESTLRNQMESFHVPRRYNHLVEGPKGGLKSRRSLVDPLWFNNGVPVSSYIAGDGYLKPSWTRRA